MGGEWPVRIYQRGEEAVSYAALLVFAVVLAVTPLAMADVFEEAEWLRDPVFEGVDVIDIYHKQNAKPPELSGPQNVHMYLRKEIEIPGKPASATLWITGDDYYKFYVNGAFVVQGPEAGYPFAHNYYKLDVTPFLSQGTNCLAAHCYYQGLLNRVWNSADNRAGFILRLDVVLESGGEVRFVSDGTWRRMTSDAYEAEDTIGYKTQFVENIDMGKIPVGWRSAGFDDSEWGAPLTGRQDHVFSKQITPPLEHWRAEPKVAKKKGEGNYFYDFGTELTGHTCIRVKGEAGHKLEVRHGEELSEPDTVRFEMRANCKYQEFPVLSGRDDVIEFYDYRAFRYVEILNAPAEPEVWVDVRHHRFDPEASTLAASDELLVRIWDLCKNGVRYGAQGGFLDCPSREKGQYLGDALITGHSHLVVTGDPSLLKKALRDFQQSQRICPGIMAVAPGSFMQEIAEYSLQWTFALKNYHAFTGDRAFLEEMTDAVFEGLYGYFARYEGESGLLTGVTEKWVLVDWPKNLRDGYDYDYAEKIENTVLNAFYYASLQTAAELLRELGKDAAVYEKKAVRVKQAFAERLLNPETGLFVDAPGSKHSALHANAIPLAFGLVAEENVPAVVALIREKRLSCGVYIAPFVIEACYAAGEHELAYDLITSKDEHSWHEMLKHGATTCMEAWGPDQKWNTSWCHPWSSGPIFLIAERVMGLTPAKPGWEVVRFEPRMPASMDHADFATTTPVGKIAMRYRRDEGYALTVPPGVSIEPHVAEGVKVEVRHTAASLSDEQKEQLAGLEWENHVADGLGVWVSVDDQAFRVIDHGELVWETACATAAKGTGSKMNSNKTPLGWHSIARKTGDGAPVGQVFRGGTPTDEIWQPGDDVEEDLVLTRVLFLKGEEPGRNQGGDVDSYRRYIYIHGTNDEARIGTPSSHGCIRLRNRDAVAAYALIPEGAPVVISESCAKLAASE